MCCCPCWLGAVLAAKRVPDLRIKVSVETAALAGEPAAGKGAIRVCATVETTKQTNRETNDEAVIEYADEELDVATVCGAIRLARSFEYLDTDTIAPLRRAYGSRMRSLNI